ncbi:MAG: DUF421 domain-containing protein [Ruminococcaceae bacterium]|nr:DUF421 domain-containing protein [Oscillospiraceae bacterium]
MLLVIFRTFLVYVLVILAMRLMGKKQLGELQPSELASTILISNLASISIEAPELPLFSSMIPVFLIVAGELVLSAICAKSHKAARLVSGSPRVIISNGKIIQTALEELRFSADDLLEALRGKDIFELEDVALAVVETNGTVSVQKSFAACEAVNGSFKFENPKAKCPSLPMVIDGVLCRDNMALYGVGEKFIEKKCKDDNCGLCDVLILLCNDAHETALVKKELR